MGNTVIATGGLDPVHVAKRAYYLAWDNAGPPVGMGILQDRPGSKEDEVWAAVCGSADYPGDFKSAKQNRDGSLTVEGDYVFGRMMKLRMRITEDAIEVMDHGRPFDVQYSGFAFKYGDADELISAAIQSLESAS